MYLQCPLCNAQRFYLDSEEAVTFFSVDAAGAAQDISTTGLTVSLTPDTEIWCSCCAWHGTVRELMASQQR